LAVVLGAIHHSLREMGINLLPQILHNFWASNTETKPESIIGKGFNIFPLMGKTEYVINSKKKLKDKFLRQCSLQ
jgi:hypothetical protein